MQSYPSPMEPVGRIFSILANSHSLLHRGQAERVFSLHSISLASVC